MLPIALGGSILALLLVGAAGSYWADRRSREVRLLSSRGVGPGALAVKAVLELALPAIAGTVLGWLAARWLVALLGPSPRLDAAAPWQAGLTALAALAAGLGLLALVAGLRSRAATERPVGARRGWVTRLPWELLILAAAAGCWLRLRGSDAVTLDAGIAQINLLVVAFPLLFLAGAAVLVMRLLALLLPRLEPVRRPAVPGLVPGRPPGHRLPGDQRDPARRRLPPDRHARLRRHPHPDLPLHPRRQGRRWSTEVTTAVQSVDTFRRTPATDAVGTLVVRYLYGKVADQPDDVTVLAVDPDTFPTTAFWDHRFADDPLGTLMAKLRAPDHRRRGAGRGRGRGRPRVPAHIPAGARQHAHPGPRSSRTPSSSPAGASPAPCSSSTAPGSAPSTGSPAR